MAGITNPLVRPTIHRRNGLEREPSGRAEAKQPPAPPRTSYPNIYNTKPCSNQAVGQVVDREEAEASTMEEEDRER